MEKRIKKVILAKWWRELNEWKWPEELSKPQNYDERAVMRGAFSVVNKLISLREVKEVESAPQQ